MVWRPAWYHLLTLSSSLTSVFPYLPAHLLWTYSPTSLFFMRRLEKREGLLAINHPFLRSRSQYQEGRMKSEGYQVVERCQGEPKSRQIEKTCWHKKEKEQPQGIDVQPAAFESCFVNLVGKLYKYGWINIPQTPETQRFYIYQTASDNVLRIDRTDIAFRSSCLRRGMEWLDGRKNLKGSHLATCLNQSAISRTRWTILPLLSKVCIYNMKFEPKVLYISQIRNWPLSSTS